MSQVIHAWSEKIISTTFSACVSYDGATDFKVTYLGDEYFTNGIWASNDWTENEIPEPEIRIGLISILKSGKAGNKLSTAIQADSVKGVEIEAIVKDITEAYYAEANKIVKN
jgi:hypothetical protein